MWKQLVATALGFIGADISRAEGFLRASGTEIVDGSGRPFLLRGMGLGGWMVQEGYMLGANNLQQHVMRQKMAELIGKHETDEFYRLWLDSYVTKADIDALADWGFNSVRVALHYDQFTPGVDEEPVRGVNTWKDQGFKRLDRLVEWAKANGLYVILDMHAAPGGQGNDLPIADRDPSKPSLWQSRPNQDKLVALWVELARRYRNEPYVGGYDLINEPNWDFSGTGGNNGCSEIDNHPVEELLRRITTAIRGVDKNHIIVVEGNCWGNNYSGINPVWDDNIVISFHKYWTYTGTETIERFLRLREKYNRPLWMGESGENSNDWFTRTIHTLETNNIGWSWWTLKKFGQSSPLQIIPPREIKEVTSYWLGKGPRPDAKVAKDALLRLARDEIRIAQNKVNLDVVDSIIRQPLSAIAQPYRDHTVNRETRALVIPAVEYDLGPNGVAYFDTVSANYHMSDGGPWITPNTGEKYRNDGVDIKLDSLGRPIVTDTRVGEWLRYTIRAEHSGLYDVSISFSEGKKGPISLTINGNLITTQNDEWTVPLSLGRNALVIRFEADNIQVDSLRVSLGRNAGAQLGTAPR